MLVSALSHMYLFSHFAREKAVPMRWCEWKHSAVSCIPERSFWTDLCLYRTPLAYVYSLLPDFVNSSYHCLE